MRGFAGMVGVALLFAGLTCADARADGGRLGIGLATDITAMDPHFHNTSSNNAASRHVFDTLIRQDERQQLRPGLALSWTPVDPTTWEIKLRPNVKFHDGSDFTAKDVVASLARAPKVLNSPSSFALYTRAVTTAEIVDPLTLRLSTAQPHPLLPNDLSLVPIISARAEQASTEDFNSGSAAIGTGPYRLVSFKRGEAIELQAYPGYWGGTPPWERVELRFMRNGQARVAGLLAGDVDAIEAPPPAMLSELRQHQKVAISATTSNKVVFLFPDTGRETTPFATDGTGTPLTKNPLRDLKVRQAISKAIDRDALASQIMQGEAIPTAQLLPEGMFGVSPRLKAMSADQGTARRLLAEAGYKDGFTLTLHGPNDRFLNDGQILPAVAAMLTRAGINAKVEVMPWNVFVTRASKPEFSLFLVGWGAGTGEPSSPLRGLLATYDRASGMGSSNRGRWSNPAFDRLLGEALATVEDGKRELALIRATEIAMDDLALIPLHHEMASWAVRHGLKHQPRADQYTMAMDFRP